MLIKYLKLTNFGKHKSIEYKNIELGTIIGLFGKNGAGKSAILTAIDFAFTRRLPETVESFIHNGEKSGSVELHFIKNGKEGKIIRKLGKSTSSSLDWDGTILTKTAEIDLKINEILGVDKQMLDNTVFIKQGAIADLLTETPTKRLELITKLLNLDFISKRFQLVDKKQNELKLSVENVGLLKDEATAKEAVVNDRDKLIAEKSLSINNKFISESALLQLKSTIEDFNIKSAEIEDLSKKIKGLKDLGISETVESEKFSKCDEIKKKLDDNKNTLRNFENVYNKYYISIGECTNVINGVKSFVKFLNNYSEFGGIKEGKENLHKFKVKLEDNKRYKKVKDEIKEIEKKISEYLLFINNNTLTLEEYKKKQSDLADTKNINSLLLTNLNTLKDTKTKLKNRLTKDDVVCPICGLKLLLGQEITDGDIGSVTKSIEYVSATLNNIEKEKELVDKKIDALNSELKLYETKVEVYKVSIKELNAIIEETKYAADLTEENATELTKHIKNLEELNFILDYNITYFRSKNRFVNNVKCLNKLQAEDIKIIKDIIDNTAESKCEDLLNKIKYFNSICNETEVLWCNLQKEKLDNIKNTERLKFLTTEMNKAITYKNSLNLKDILEKFNLEFDLDYILNKFIPEGLNEYKNIVIEKEINNRAKLYLDDLKAKIKYIENKNNKVYSTIMNLEAIKNIINIKDPNSIPRAYIDYLFKFILDSASDLLFRMNSNFIIDADTESCSFKFKRIDTNDDYWMPISKLSGGQKVKLSIVLLLAIHEVICPDLGFLVLDEPSTHLDTDSAEALSETLRELSLIMKNKKSQLWIVDHNDILSSCSDIKFNI